ncbi:MAG: hypothetical protein ACYC9S_00635 [Leptospirales bacterium]
MLREVILTHMGAFRECAFSFSPGLNVLTGMNGTGKTHLLRLVHAGVRHLEGIRVEESLQDLFLFPGEPLDRILFRDPFVREGNVSFRTDAGAWSFHLESPGKRAKNVRVRVWSEGECLMPGSFLFPLGEMPEVSRTGRSHPRMKLLIERIEKSMPGQVIVRGNRLKVRNTRGEMELSLVTPVVRQLGLLSFLIRRGQMVPGSILLWDIPEADAGPTFLGQIGELLLFLQRSGIQVIVATRDYLLLKEIDLLRKTDDLIRFHSLFRDEKADRIRVSVAEDFSGISPNPASEAFRSLFDRDVDRALSRQGVLWK